MSHLAIGTLLIALGLWGMFAWWDCFGLVMRGLVPLALLAVGLVAILSSYYRLGTGIGTEDESEAAAHEE